MLLLRSPAVPQTPVDHRCWVSELGFAAFTPFSTDFFFFFFFYSPGETLPEFPQPTHSLPGGGLKPIETIHSTINDIPLDASNHDVEGGLQRWALLGWRQPYNGHQPARTLTCNGGDSNYHPSGKRSFTCRELASLQTFPVNFQFSKSNVRKQIGNAVPPKFAEAVFREIRRSLRETDEKELQQREARRVGGM